MQCAASKSVPDVPAKSVPVKEYEVPEVVVVSKSPPPPPPKYYVKVETPTPTPVPEVVVSGVRLVSPPPPEE